MSDIVNNSTLTLKQIALSDNPNAKVVDAPEYANIPGLNGKINESTDGRKYFIAWFKDPKNPFIASSPVVVMQTSNNGVTRWRAGDPTELKDFIGKEIPGAIVTREVEPYEITTADGSRTVTSYTTVVYGGQSINIAFKNSGHTIVSNNQAIHNALQGMHADAGFTGGGQDGMH